MRQQLPVAAKSEMGVRETVLGGRSATELMTDMRITKAIRYGGIGLSLFLSACPSTGKLVELSDKEIKKLVEKRGGVVIDPKGKKTRLRGLKEGHRFEVKGTPKRGIDIKLVGKLCRQYCWATVMRQFLDKKLVTKFTSLTAADADARFKRGQRKKEKKHVGGYVVDNGPDKSICHPSYLRSISFADEPHFPNKLFRTNKINSSARLFIAEFETCVRCEIPRSGWFGCVSWYYAKIRRKARDGFGDTYLVTKAQVKKPTDNFKKAIRRWTQNP